MAKKKPDWRKIAHALGQRVNFAVGHLHAKGEGKGGGCLLDINTGTMQHWKDYMADALEMIPGVTADRELMHCETYRERKKLLASRDAARAASSTTRAHK